MSPELERLLEALHEKLTCPPEEKSHRIATFERLLRDALAPSEFQFALTAFLVGLNWHGGTSRSRPQDFNWFDPQTTLTEALLQPSGFTEAAGPDKTWNPRSPR